MVMVMVRDTWGNELEWQGVLRRSWLLIMGWNGVCACAASDHLSAENLRLPLHPPLIETVFHEEDTPRSRFLV